VSGSAAVQGQRGEVLWEAVEVEQRGHPEVILAVAVEDASKVREPVPEVTASPDAMAALLRVHLARDGGGRKHAVVGEVGNEELVQDGLFGRPFHDDDQPHHGRPPMTPLPKTSDKL